MNVHFGHERVILIELFNQNDEALRTIKSEIIRFERYLDQSVKVDVQSQKSTNSTDKLIELLRQVPVQSDILSSMLLHTSFLHGIIATSWIAS